MAFGELASVGVDLNILWDPLLSTARGNSCNHSWKEKVDTTGESREVLYVRHGSFHNAQELDGLDGRMDHPLAEVAQRGLQGLHL